MQPGKEPTKRWRRRLLIGLGATAAVAALWTFFFLRRTYALEAELKAAVAELSFRGGPISLQSLREKFPPEPNGAADLMRAILLANSDTADRLRKGNGEVTKNVRLVVGDVPPTGSISWAGISYKAMEEATPGIHPEFSEPLAALPQIVSVLEKSVAAPPGRLSRFVDDSKPYGWKPHLQDMTLLSLMLRIEVLDALGRDDARRAFRGLLLLSRLDGCLTEEPCLLAHLIRVNVICTAANTLIDALGSIEFTPAEFDALDAQLARWNTGSMAPYVEGDFCTVIGRFAPEGLPDFLNVVVLGRPESGIFRNDVLRRNYAAYFASELGRPERLREQLTAIRYLQKFVRWIDGPEADAVSDEEIESAESEREKTFAASSILGSVRSARRLVRNRRLASCFTRLALRVSRHRWKTGELPEELNGIPDGQVAVGSSPLLKGKSPVYERTASGFRISEPLEAGRSIAGRMRLLDSSAWVGVSVDFRPKSTPNGAGSR